MKSMTITLDEEQLSKILYTVSQHGDEYNGAWLDGYQHLALELGIVKWDREDNRYTLAGKGHK